ncbi:MAG: dihydroorotase family protein [Cyclobacteriaceae bacterium]
MSILIKSALVIAPNSSYHLERLNLLIDQNGQIEYIGKKDQPADTIISSADLHVSIGWFDMRADFCDPGYEHKEDLISGANAAAAGGFTEVALLPNTKPCIQSKNDIRYLTRSNAYNLVKIHPYGAVTLGCKGDELTEMIDMFEAGAVAFTDGKNPVWNTDILVKTLQYLQKFDGLLLTKPEDKFLTAFGTMNEGYHSTLLGMKGIPKLAEEIMIMRDLKLLQYAGGKIHFSNISSAESVKLIRNAKKKGLQVSCDVSAAHLYFDDSALLEYDTNYKVDPPLREERDIRALERGLRDDIIDVIVSSHVPEDEESKKLEFDLAENGMLGLQTLYPIIASKNEEEIDKVKFLEKITNNPRKLLGLEIPEITKGALANLTLFDPSVSWIYDKKTNQSKSENSPLLGKKLQGKVIGVIRGAHAKFN